MPAAVAFCAAGLLAAVFVIALNRVLSSRPPVGVIPVVPPAGSTPTPGTVSTPASTSASTAAAASCAEAPRVSAPAPGTVTTTGTTVEVTSGDSTLAVQVPAGAQVDGSAGDLHVHLQGQAGPPQPLHGTVVQAVELCAAGTSGPVRLSVAAGVSLDGSGVATPSGVEGVDVHFHTGGGGEGD